MWIVERSLRRSPFVFKLTDTYKGCRYMVVWPSSQAMFDAFIVYFFKLELIASCVLCCILFLYSFFH